MKGKYLVGQLTGWPVGRLTGQRANRIVVNVYGDWGVKKDVRICERRIGMGLVYRVHWREHLPIGFDVYPGKEGQSHISVYEFEVFSKIPHSLDYPLCQHQYEETASDDDNNLRFSHLSGLNSHIAPIP